MHTNMYRSIQLYHDHTVCGDFIFVVIKRLGMEEDTRIVTRLKRLFRKPNLISSLFCSQVFDCN